MNHRIRKKRYCLNGASYRFGSYHEHRIACRIQHQAIKECLLRCDTWVIKFPHKWIVIPEVSNNVNTHYKRCLKYKLTINEEVERFQ